MRKFMAAALALSLAVPVPKVGAQEALAAGEAAEAEDWDESPPPALPAELTGLGAAGPGCGFDFAGWITWLNGEIARARRKIGRLESQLTGANTLLTSLQALNNTGTFGPFTAGLLAGTAAGANPVNTRPYFIQQFIDALRSDPPNYQAALAAIQARIAQLTALIIAWGLYVAGLQALLAMLQASQAVCGVAVGVADIFRSLGGS